MSKSLKRCPFCGSEEIDCHNYCRNGDVWFVHCANCYVAFPYFDSKEEAVEVWNKRYEPPIESRKCDDCGEVMKFVSLDGRGKSVGYFECKECGCQTNIFWYQEPKSPNSAYTPAREERLKRGNKNA